MVYKISFIILFILSFSILKAQTGIGTTTPVNKFEVVATTADPATSGTAANGNLRIGATGVNTHVLDFGLSSTSTFSWLQARDRSNYATIYNLVFNPNGGNVGIGTTTPTAKLNLVGGGIRMATGFNNSGTRPAINTGTIGAYEIRGVGSGGSGTSQNDGADDGFLRISAGGGAASGAQSSIDISGFSTVADMNNNIVMRTAGVERLRLASNGRLGLGTATPTTSLHIENGNIFGSGDPGNTVVPSLYIYNTNSASTTAHSILTIRTNNSGGGNPYLSFDINSVKGYSMGIDNADGDKFKFHNNWSFNNSNTPILTITSDNRVGIGTTSPEVPLHVASSVSQYVNVYGYLNQNQAQGAYVANTNVSYSIQTDGRIRAPEFNAISDVRIKKGITSLNATNQLADLNRLRVVDYSYIDQLANGNKNKTGFIAQEVEAVNAQFVNQSTDFIPSVFALAKTASLDKGLMTVSTEKSHEFAKGDVVKFFAEGKKEVVSTIESITDSQTFTVKGWIERTDNVFIYGKKITDFRAIDFDQITALSVGAIQELSKQIDSLKIENEKLKKKQSDFEARLLRLEAKINY